MLAVQFAVFANDYYTSIYLSALGKHGMSVDSVKAGRHSDAEIVRVANTFWEWLPDTSAIRREPFFALCDIAEHVFDELEDVEYLTKLSHHMNVM